MPAIADYKTSLRIADKLKHNQGCLRGIGIYPAGGVRLGYFLEEPDEEGVLGPSPDIHPDQGAFSFARDLQWRFFLVYALSENLVKAIERALLGLHQVRLERVAAVQKQEDWHRLVTMVAKLGRAIFPKEQQKSIATVLLTEDGQRLSIKFPDRIRILDSALQGNVRAVVSTVGDGFSRQFNVPYPSRRACGFPTDIFYPIFLRLS